MALQSHDLPEIRPTNQDNTSNNHTVVLCPDWLIATAGLSNIVVAAQRYVATGTPLRQRNNTVA
jgi:hypothetical protein